MSIYDDQYDLEDALAADADGSNLREVQNGLQEGLQSVRRLIDKGLAPADFKRAEGLKKAFEAALEVTETSWKNYRQQ